ncbi:hypothetical protein BGZ76_010862 [Entomortierella beljakovae]|nr:hypothetical protein BGZ76_010862 [Entomortierella beljakovae]
MEPQDQANLPTLQSAFSHSQLAHHDQDPNNDHTSLTDLPEDHTDSTIPHSNSSSSINTLNKTIVNNNSTSSINPSQSPAVRSPQSSASFPNQPSASVIQPPRVSTPVANPPPRFFTRPYRRTQDHHHSQHSHHHGSANSSGFNSNQNSSIIGVRSAFKDFAVPAQIILVCSVINALWPTMLRVVTTIFEFLVLILSSYVACARRSDDCYFLEPLLHDGEEAVYVEIIQWTLRGALGFFILSGVHIAIKKIQQFRTVLTTHQHSHWFFTILWPLITKYPSLLWSYSTQIFSWRFIRTYRSSAPTRSSQSIRRSKKASSLSASSADQYRYHTSSKSRSSNASHSYSKRSGASSAIDTDAFSAGSGSETKLRSKTKPRKSRGIDVHSQQSNYQTPAHTEGLDSSLQINTPDTEESEIPTISIDPVSCQDIKSSTITTSNTDDNCISATEAASNTVYETADDGEFISTDRRRRRKAKSLKAVAVSNSTESLTKPKPQVPASLNTKTTVETPIVSQLPKSGTKDTSATVKAMTVKSAHQESSSTKKIEQEKAQITHKSWPSKKDNSQVKSQSTTSINASESLLQPPKENTFVHPLHALNSTSPIVRLKPSHKRSQSAQLPLPSPWNRSQSTTPDDDQRLETSNQPSAAGDATEVLSASAEPKSKQEDSPGFRSYDLFGESGIWYSPFQSGLDIAIESDREQGKHGSRPLSKPRIQTNNANNSKKPNIPPSSFFESSPRAPRIMPFSQHHSGNALQNEDWLVRTRSSSVAAPMTPLLESDCQDPLDYFGGSRSANSSRRGSTENNLTESLLSGRTRMFGAAPSSVGHSRQNSQQLFPLSGSTNVSTIEAPYLSAQFNGSINPPTFNPIASSSAPIGGETPFGSPMLTADNSTDAMAMTESSSTFVNPWDSGFTYNNNSQPLPEPFLNFDTPATSQNLSREADHSRQSSLLRLMNGDSGVNNAHVDGEGDAILRGFLFPSLAHHAQTSIVPTETHFQPFASEEIPHTGAVSQPGMFTGELNYNGMDFPIQTMSDMQQPYTEASFTTPFQLDPIETKTKERYHHGRKHSGHHKSSSLGSFFLPFPPVSGTSEGSPLGIQADSQDIPIQPSSISRGGSSGSNNSGRGQRHGQHKQVRHQSSSRDREGNSPTTGRRRAGTDHEARNRASNKHNPQQDSNKPKKPPKKEQTL